MGFGYFYSFHISSHIFVVYGPVLNIFWDDIFKLFFPIVLSIQYVIYFDRRSVCHHRK